MCNHVLVDYLFEIAIVPVLFIRDASAEYIDIILLVLAHIGCLIWSFLHREPCNMLGTGSLRRLGDH